MIFTEWIEKNADLFTKWDSDEFAELFPGKSLDSYGTTLYQDIELKPMIMNTYGDEDNYPDDVIFCACGIFTLPNSKRYVEVADIVYSDGKIHFINEAKGDIPEEITRHDFFRTLGIGKRAFYYYRDKKQVSLRIDNDAHTYVLIPEKYRHSEAQNWLSGPRVLINVKSICKTSKSICRIFKKSSFLGL